MTRFETIINDFKTRVAEGIEPALKFLEQVLSPGSDNYNDFIQIKGRYSNLQRELLLGTLDPEIYDKARAGISQALLLLADTLREDDLKPETAQPVLPADKRGEVLYRIPDRMQLGHEEKCVVRLAWALEQVLRDWEKSADDVVKNIRMAEIMGVSLLNVDERNPFAIRTISEPVQFVDQDDFTEWIFYVKPLLVGQFPLALRVSVIEMINGREIKKDIVLEEQILVVTEEVPPSAEGFKKADESLIVAAAATGAPDRQNTEQTPPQTTETKRRSRWLGIALSTVALAAVAVFVGVPYVRDELAWGDARRGGKPSDYRDYLKKYPDGHHRQAAQDSIKSREMPRDTADSAPTPGLSEVVEPPPAAIDTVAAQAAEPAPKPGPKKTAPPKKTVPPKRTPGRPPDKTPPPKPPVSDPTPPVGPGAPPELTGNVAPFGLKPFSIVKDGETEFQVKFLKFNENGQSLVIVAGRGDWVMRAGQELTFVQNGGKSVATQVTYVARTDQGWLDGYFLLDRAALQQLADGKVSALRWHDRRDHQIKTYALPGSKQRELREKARQALKKTGQ